MFNGISGTSLRQKAQEIKEAGEEARGDYTPTGVPLRLYKYWAKHSDNVPDRENFCHYWRVVGLWAPLAWLRVEVLEPIYSHTAAWVLTVLAILAVLVGLGFAFPGFGTAELIIFLVMLGSASIATGGVMADDPTTVSNFTTLEKVVWFGLMAVGVLGLFTYPLVRLFKHLDSDVIGSIVVGVAATAAVVLAAGALYALFAYWGWFGFVWIVSVLVISGLFVGGTILIGNLLSALRVRSRNKQKERLEWLDDENGPVEVEPQPGRFARFFSGLADFCILVAQVVRVNKWKICPIVEVENELK